MSNGPRLPNGSAYNYQQQQQQQQQQSMVLQQQYLQNMAQQKYAAANNPGMTPSSSSGMGTGAGMMNRGGGGGQPPNRGSPHSNPNSNHHLYSPSTPAQSHHHQQQQTQYSQSQLEANMRASQMNAMKQQGMQSQRRIHLPSSSSLPPQRYNTTPQQQHPQQYYASHQQQQQQQQQQQHHQQQQRRAPQIQEDAIPEGDLHDLLTTRALAVPTFAYHHDSIHAIFDPWSTPQILNGSKRAREESMSERMMDRTRSFISSNGRGGEKGMLSEGMACRALIPRREGETKSIESRRERLEAILAGIQAETTQMEEEFERSKQVAGS